jgi:uncharacterized protein (TIGR04222 family)
VQAATHAEGANPVERTVLADVKRYGRRSAAMLTNRLAESDAVKEVVAGLVRAGYLLDEDLAARRKRLGMIPAVAVLAVGVARLLAGLADDHPVGYLILLLIGSGLIVYLLRRETTCPRTFQGTLAVKAIAIPDTPAGSVAAGGMHNHPDQTIRMSLSAASTPRRSGYDGYLIGGASAGGAGCGSGGGSSCGGGGCGG